MTKRSRERQRRSVGRLIARTLYPVLVLMLLLGVVGVIGAWRTNHAVSSVSDNINPAALANGQLRELMTSAQDGVRAWSVDADADGLSTYQASIASAPEVAARLQGLVSEHQDLVILVQHQEQLITAWRQQYAEPRLAAGPGSTGFDADRFAVGEALARQTHAVNAELDHMLGAERSKAVDAADAAFRRAVVAMIVLTIPAAALAWYSGRRLQHKVGKPLAGMQHTVQRWAEGDTGARNRVAGPTEIAAVAMALNRLAEEENRAREVETQTLERLLALDQAKSDFVSNVSHELRTPLTSIKGYVELLRDEAEPDGQSARQWDVVERNIDRLQSMIEDILDLARLEGRDPQLGIIDLRHIVEDAVDDLRITAAGRGITIKIELPADTEVPILADEGELMRAVLNVASNAVKFCRDDGDVDITLTTSSASQAILTVRDTGIGIPADELDKLGSRFFRASNAVRGQVSGTGLGIRMVQSIVAKHGGDVTFESVEDQYTLVTITLPLAPLEESPRGDIALR